MDMYAYQLILASIHTVLYGLILPFLANNWKYFFFRRALCFRTVTLFLLYEFNPIFSIGFLFLIVAVLFCPAHSGVKMDGFLFG